MTNCYLFHLQDLTNLMTYPLTQLCVENHNLIFNAKQTIIVRVDSEGLSLSFLFKICVFIICHRFLVTASKSRRWGHPIWKTCWEEVFQKFTKVSGKSSHCPPFFGHPNAMASWISGQDGLNRNWARRTQFPSNEYVQRRQPYVVVGLMRVSVLKLVSKDYTKKQSWYVD